MNSAFLSPLRVELVCPWSSDGTGQWQLTRTFSYYSALLQRVVDVPLGFSTDFATVPKLPLVYLVHGGRYARPAVVHDFLCRQGYILRNRADRVFLEAMRVENAEELKALAASGADVSEIDERAQGLEARAYSMYLAVAFYTRTGRWKTEVDDPDYEPVA